MNMTGFTPLGDAQNVPLIAKDRTPQFGAVLTKTTGAHSFKVGGGVILREFASIQSSSPHGIFTFNPNLTRSTTGTGRQLRRVVAPGVSRPPSREPLAVQAVATTPTNPTLFVQDDWRTTDWLTLNLGLRYDVFTPFTEENNQLSNLDPFDAGRSTWPARTARRERPA